MRVYELMLVRGELTEYWSMANKELKRKSVGGFNLTKSFETN